MSNLYEDIKIGDYVDLEEMIYDSDDEDYRVDNVIPNSKVIGKAYGNWLIVAKRIGLAIAVPTNTSDLDDGGYMATIASDPEEIKIEPSPDLLRSIRENCRTRNTLVYHD